MPAQKLVSFPSFPPSHCPSSGQVWPKLEGQTTPLSWKWMSMWRERWELFLRWRVEAILVVWWWLELRFPSRHGHWHIRTTHTYVRSSFIHSFSQQVDVLSWQNRWGEKNSRQRTVVVWHQPCRMIAVQSGRTYRPPYPPTYRYENRPFVDMYPKKVEQWEGRGLNVAKPGLRFKGRHGRHWRLVKPFEFDSFLNTRKDTLCRNTSDFDARTLIEEREEFSGS